MIAQEPAVRPGGRGNADKGITAAIAGSKEDPAAFERGAKAYTQYCAGCHGATGRGSVGAPDLVRSILVLDDEKGILIAPGYSRTAGPTPECRSSASPKRRSPTSSHGCTCRRTRPAIAPPTPSGRPHRRREKRRSVFQRDTCTGCHSATGDLKGIGSRYDAFSLQARWLQPRGGRGGRRGRGGGHGIQEERDHRHRDPAERTEPITGILDPNRRFQRLPARCLRRISFLHLQGNTPEGRDSRSPEACTSTCSRNYPTPTSTT